MGANNLSRFLQHPLNCSFFNYFPPAVTFLYTRMLGRLYFCRHPEEKERYVKPLRTTLATGRKERGNIDRVAGQMLRGVFEHYFEKLLTAYWGYARMRRMLRRQVTLVHRDLLDGALRQGNGVILTTAHYGAVEFLPASLAFQGYPVTMAVRYQTVRLKRTLEMLADTAGIELLDANAGTVLPRALIALRQGRIFIFELDEIKHWRPTTSKVMTFFGQRVCLDRTAEVLQERTGAPLLLGLMERVGGRRYQLVFESPREHVPAPTGLGPDAQLLKRLEHYIYDCPEHWYQWKDLVHLEQLAV